MDDILVCILFFTKRITDYLLVWFLIMGISRSEINTYYMNDYCNSKLNMATEKIDQLKLVLDDDNIYNNNNNNSSNNNNNNRGWSCEIKIETWYNSYNKIMFYFEHLNLDCREGHLEFYVLQNKDTHVKGLEDETCGTEKPEGVFVGDTRFLKIIYTSSRRPRIMTVFSLIVTAFRDDTCPGHAHECDNSRCIDKDIVCNGYNSCGDNSSCSSSTSIVFGIVIACIVAILCVVALCCTYRLRQKGRNMTTCDNARNENQIPALNFEEYERSGSNSQIHRITAIGRDIDYLQIDGHTNRNTEHNDHDEQTLPPGYNEMFGSNEVHLPAVNETNNLTRSPDAHNSNNAAIYSDNDTGLPSYSELFTTNLSEIYPSQKECQNTNATLPLYSELCTQNRLEDRHQATQRAQSLILDVSHISSVDQSIISVEDHYNQQQGHVLESSL